MSVVQTHDIKRKWKPNVQIFYCIYMFNVTYKCWHTNSSELNDSHKPLCFAGDTKNISSSLSPFYFHKFKHTKCIFTYSLYQTTSNIQETCAFYIRIASSKQKRAWNLTTLNFKLKGAWRYNILWIMATYSNIGLLHQLTNTLLI